jgi:transposase
MLALVTLGVANGVRAVFSRKRLSRVAESRTLDLNKCRARIEDRRTISAEISGGGQPPYGRYHAALVPQSQDGYSDNGSEHVLQSRRLGQSCTLLSMRKSYSTDLSAQEWAYLRRRLAELSKTVRTCTHSLRNIFDAIFYVSRSGCRWRLLPHDFPPWSTVHNHFRKFRLSGPWHHIFTILRAAERMGAGQVPDASAVVRDSQSVKTTEECGRSKGYVAHTNGYDAHKNVMGRKRHLLVGTLGLPLSVYITPANDQNRSASFTHGVKTASISPDEDLGRRSLRG